MKKSVSSVSSLSRRPPSSACSRRHVFYDSSEWRENWTVTLNTARPFSSCSCAPLLWSLIGWPASGTPSETWSRTAPSAGCMRSGFIWGSSTTSVSRDQDPASRTNTWRRYTSPSAAWPAWASETCRRTPTQRRSSPSASCWSDVSVFHYLKVLFYIINIYS